MKKLSFPKYLVFLVLPLFVAISCSHLTTKTPPADLAQIPHKSPDEISIMSFNVENLFDTDHDLGKEDYTYLPLAKKQSDDSKAYCAAQASFRKQECLGLNWTSEILDKKLSGIAQVILSIDKNGPDNLILIEVENEKVLQLLNQKYLHSAYQTVILIEGWDPRGIDVGFLSKLPLAGQPQLNKIPFKATDGLDVERATKTRGILQIPVELPNKEKLTIFGAHFPSQGNPRVTRKQSVEYLTSLIEQESKKGPVIGGGDLNITDIEEQETHFFSENFSKVGMVSHLVGCKSCLGSHLYRKSWSFLDALIFSKNLDVQTGSSGYVLDPESIQVVRHPIHINKFGEPIRFNDETGAGISDHFPLYARLKKRSSESKK